MTRRTDIHSFLHATTLLTELLLVVWIWRSFFADDRFFLLLPILDLIMGLVSLPFRCALGKLDMIRICEAE
jgi:hypothetical protein